MAKIPDKAELLEYGKNFDEDRVKVSMRKWLDKVKVPANEQDEIMDAMISRYGHSAAYTLMLRAMVEPLHVMEELKESLGEGQKLTSIGVIRRMATGTELEAEQVELLSGRTKESKQNSDDNSKGTNNGNQGNQVRGNNGNQGQGGQPGGGNGEQTPPPPAGPTKPVLDKKIANLGYTAVLDEAGDTMYYFDAEKKKPAALVYANGDIAYYKENGKPTEMDRYVYANGDVTYYKNNGRNKDRTEHNDGSVTYYRRNGRMDYTVYANGERIYYKNNKENGVDAKKTAKKNAKSGKGSESAKQEKTKKSNGDDEGKTSRIMIDKDGNTTRYYKNGEMKWVKYADGSEIHYRKDGTRKWSKDAQGKKTYYDNEDNECERKNFFQRSVEWVTGLVTKAEKKVSAVKKKADEFTKGAENAKKIMSDPKYQKKIKDAYGKEIGDVWKALADDGTRSQVAQKLGMSADASQIEVFLKLCQKEVSGEIGKVGSQVEDIKNILGVSGGSKSNQTPQGQNSGMQYSITANDFVITDANGNEVHYSHNGDVLFVKTKEGNVDIELGIDEKGEFCVQENPNTADRISTTFDKDGNVTFMTMGQTRLGFSEDGCLESATTGIAQVSDEKDILDFKDPEDRKVLQKYMQEANRNHLGHDGSGPYLELELDADYRARLEQMNTRLRARYDELVEASKAAAQSTVDKIKDGIIQIPQPQSGR